MFQKKILIIGPISDFGGREVEVKNIIKTLSNNFEVELLSTIPMTNNSVAISGVNVKWSTIQKDLFNSKYIIKLTSCVSKFFNNFDFPPYYLVANRLSNLFYDFHYENVQVIQNRIEQVQIVIFCGIFENAFLKEIYDYTIVKEKVFFFRSTGAVNDIPNHIAGILTNFSAIIVHSQANAVKIAQISPQNIHIIDQSTLHESQLLQLPIEPQQNLVYGYLGRFSAEKGILELVDSFQGKNEKLIIAGAGSLEKEVKNGLGSNVVFIGKLAQDQIESFFENIDVLIIPSLEEAGPLVGIEAMAGGKLIFSTKVGAMKERLSTSENHFWIGSQISNDIQELIGKVQKMNPVEIVRIRELNRKIYLENYCLEQVSKQYVHLINSFQN